MSRVLILFAHPNLQSSRVHRRLMERVRGVHDVTFHDLYEVYPRLFIDIDREQELAESHDVLVFQHPFFWYSTPPLIKQWEDVVLEHGWAYGSQGHALEGKRMMNVVSTGGTEGSYRPGGFNRFTVRQLLAPIEQTARLCGMTYLPPFVVFGTHRMDPPAIDAAADRYERLIVGLRDDTLELEPLLDGDTLNEAVAGEAS